MRNLSFYLCSILIIVNDCSDDGSGVCIDHDLGGPVMCRGGGRGMSLGCRDAG